MSEILFRYGRSSSEIDATQAAQLPGAEIEPVQINHEFSDDFDPFTRFSPFEDEVQGIKAKVAAADDPASLPNYLGSGIRSDAFILANDMILRLPRQAEIPQAALIDEYVQNLKAGHGVVGLEQLIAASREQGATISEPIAGPALKDLGLEDILSISQGDLDALCSTFEAMAERGLRQENPLSDTRYDSAASNPHEAFGIVDYQANIHEPLSIPIDRFATAIATPHRTLIQAATREDFRRLVEEQEARLKLLNLLSNICQSRYPDSFELTDRIEALSLDGQRLLGKFQNDAWVQARITDTI